MMVPDFTSSSAMRRLLLLTFAAALSASVFVHADDLVLSRFSDYLDALRAQAGIPGMSATILRLGDTTWEGAYGRSDLDRGIATRADTPFEVDGLTQLFSADIALRCVEEGKLLLDDPIAKYAPDSLYAASTIRQILTHTSIGIDGSLVYAYRPERWNALVAPIAACTNTKFLDAVTSLLDRFAMVDSVPGSDIVTLLTSAPAPTEPLTQDQLQAQQLTLARYASVLDRLAKPYAVDSRGRTSPTQYVATSLTPGAGLISTVRDLGKFDAAIRRGLLLKPETLAAAWTPPLDVNGQRLPHGLGWFVGSYNGERIVWQFGVSDNASSSLLLTVPSRGLTLILLANGQGLSRPFALASGDVTVSPFARLFLSVFVR